MNVLVEDNPAARRFEALVDGGLAGFVEYRWIDGTMLLTRTEILPGYAGTGLDDTLIGGALDEIHRRGGRAAARCPSVAAFVDRHPAYRELLDRH